MHNNHKTDYLWLEAEPFALAETFFFLILPSGCVDETGSLPFLLLAFAWLVLPEPLEVLAGTYAGGGGGGCTDSGGGEGGCTDVGGGGGGCTYDVAGAVGFDEPSDDVGGGGGCTDDVAGADDAGGGGSLQVDLLCPICLHLLHFIPHIALFS